MILLQYSSEASERIETEEVDLVLTVCNCKWGLICIQDDSQHMRQTLGANSWDYFDDDGS